MNVVITFDDNQNNYSIPIALLAKELGLTREDIERAVSRLVEKY